MKDLNFTPVSVHDTDAQALGEAFSAEPETGLGADQHQNAQGGGAPHAVKLHALEHGTHMQKVIDIALRNYLNSNELPKYRSTEV